MICPRCGFDVAFTPCRLCGLQAFDSYELDRYKEQVPSRFECTVVIRRKDIVQQGFQLSFDRYRHAHTDEMEPRYFVFFSDDQHEQLFEFLRSIQGLNKWSLMVNGRIRPFARELWIPLLELSET
jgi:hypothetical protein